MEISDFEMAQRLCAKFCHDMAGSIGAVNNGVEFLQSDISSDMKNKAIELIASSAFESVAKLQFFRVIYGFTPEDSEQIMSHLKGIVEGFFKNSNINVIWEDNHEPQISPELAKIICNLLMVVAGNLIYGGNITITIQKDGKLALASILGEGENIKVDGAMVKAITEKKMNVEVDNRNIQFYYISRLIKYSGAKVGASFDNRKIKYTVEYIVK